MYKDNVSIEEFFEGLAENESVRLVDVRTAEEWAETGIADIKSPTGLACVVSKPDMELKDDFIQNLEKYVNKDEEIYFICRSSYRSQIAAANATKNGFADCYSIDGGMMEWIEKGNAVKDL